MPCASIKRQLSAYLDQRLSREERAQIQAHLSDCPACRSEMAGMEEVIKRLHAMTPPESPDLLPDIHRKLQVAAARPTLAKRFLAPWPASLPWHGLAVATCALAVLMTVRHVRLPGQASGLVERGELRSARSLAGQSGDKLFDQRLESLAYKRDPSDRLDMPMSAAQTMSDIDARTRFDDAMRFQESGQPAKDDPQQLARRLESRSGISEGASLDSRLSAVQGRASFEAVDSQSPLRTMERTSSPALAIHQDPAHAPSPEVSYNAGSVSGVAAPDANQALSARRSAQASLVSSVESQPPLQVRWQANDLAEAKTQLSEWLTIHHGWIAADHDRRLTIMVPSEAVNAFLQQFAHPADEPPPVSPGSIAAISLEIVLRQ
jgi:hypothetical protein